MRGAATTRFWSSRSLIVGAVLAVSVLGPAARAEPGDTIWTSTYGVPEQVERGRDSVLAPDGSRLFVTGVDAEGPAGDFLTVAYDATTGSQLWVSTYDAGRRDEANHVAVAPDGSRVYVVGFSRGDEVTGADYVTIAYDAATGEELWAARHSGTGRRTDEPSCIAASDTHVFVTGSSRERSSWDFVTIAYDAANGQFRWLARFDHRDSMDFAQGCALAPDDSAFFVTGLNHIGDRDPASAVTIAYSSLTGGTIWSDRFDDRGLKWDEGIAMTTSSDGLHVYVVGLSNRGTPDYLTVAYEATSGSVEWHRVNEASGFGAALDVAVTPDGATVFATGYSAPLVRTVAYSTVDGQERWRRTYRAQDFGTGESLAVSPDGSIVYVVGWEAFQSFAVAYDGASGATLWERHEPASAWGSVSTSSNGDLYLAGIIAVGEDRNVLVAAYDGVA